MEKVAFITVRVASLRLYGKCLLPFGDGNVLQHVIRRAKWYGFDRVIVCTTTEGEDDVVARVSEELCPTYRGSATDVLARWLGTCDHFGVKAFHYIGADDVFFDGELGKIQLELIDKYSLDFVYPPANTYVGSCAFSMTADIVRKACETKKSDNTEVFWPYIEKVSPKTNICRRQKGNFRLTLDYLEDYWMLLTVLRILGPMATREQIEDLFIRNPDLRMINWFRQEDYLKHQAEAGK